MSNTQSLRRRIRSVKSTRQITKAMELVAAAKMRKAQNQAVKSRNYSSAGFEVLQLLSGANNELTHQLLQKPEKTARGLLIVICSDKGLAGSYNGLVLRSALNLIKAETVEYDLITVGKKAQNFFSKLGKNIIATFTDIPPYPTAVDIKPIIDIAIADFIGQKYGKVSVAFTKFHSTVKQEALVEQLLPVESQSENKDSEIDFSNNDFIFEPSQTRVLEAMVPRLIETQLYQKMLEAIASEHSARMVAMKNASDNAGDIIDDLNSTYNTVRQAGITKELAEITAGANAI